MRERIEQMRRHQQDMALFSKNIIGLPLYPYQVEWADYVVGMVRERRIETVVVEMSRQSGKNETSAQVEVNLIAQFARRGGSIVKLAPTWKPQIINSKLRFAHRAEMAQRRLSFLKIKPSAGYMYLCRSAMIQFLSADPEASVVGATANLLMEVDESQDVDVEKFDKDFVPMRASTAAPVVHYGTTWSDATLLERTKQEVLEGRVQGKCYRITPDIISLANPRYGDFVDSEVRRLGREHPLIRTQYFLEPLPESGRMLTEQQLRLMIGDHPRQERRTNERWIVGGLDFAGADEEATGISSLMTMSARDSVALTIAQAELLTLLPGLPAVLIRILARYEWVNVRPDSLHTVLYDLLQNRWKIDRLHCDATGIGATATGLLAAALNTSSRERVVGLTFDSAWTTHTRLAFGYLAQINGGRLIDYKPDGFDPMQVAKSKDAPSGDAGKHAWWQRGHAKLEAKIGKKVRAHVPEKEGHDDLLVCEMLMTDAALALLLGDDADVATIEAQTVSRQKVESLLG